MDKWRLDGFIRNITTVKNPVRYYEGTKCTDCPPQIHLFGISDDGLGHKGIEVQAWIDKDCKLIVFLDCKKKRKPSKT